VVNVVDRDTIGVLIDSVEYRIRYIGIDTPETVHPTRGEEPYGTEASARNRELMLGQTVNLERDVSERDQYGRLLRYVWLEDGRMVNAVLVAEGYAQVSTCLPDVKYADQFLELQHVARGGGLGLWGLAPTTATEGGCDPGLIPVCVYRHRLRTSTAGKSPLPTSRFWPPTRTGSTETRTGLGASGRN